MLNLTGITEDIRWIKWKKNASILCLICLLVLVVFVSGCTTSNNTSNQRGDVMVQIYSNSPWNGTLTHNGVNYNIRGASNKEKNYKLGPNPGHVTIYLKKYNNVGKLTVQLIQGTNIIQTQSISSHQEAINISQNF